MRRTIYSFMLMFLAVGTVSAQQAIAEVAKKVWKDFPKECTAIKKDVVNIWVDNHSVPLGSVRPTLIGSVEAAFVESIPSADLVSVSNSIGSNPCSSNSRNISFSSSSSKFFIIFASLYGYQ